MAERITWTKSGAFSWEGKMGNQAMFSLFLNAREEFLLRKSSSLGRGLEIAKGTDVSVLKAKAEAMLQNLVDQGLPLE